MRRVKGGSVAASPHRPFRANVLTGSVATVIAALAMSPAMAQEAGSPAAADASIAEPEQIVVTGSRIVRDGFAAPTPVSVITSDTLSRLGVTDMADAINRLPSVRATSTQTTSLRRGTESPATTADLRGLGSSRTLVLVDGRRFTPSTTDGSIDLGMIPSALVQRSEVVTGGASAAYGSDAVAGVVNLILDRKLNGLKMQVDFTEANRGDSTGYHASLAGGTDLFGGRAHLIGALEYDENKGSGRCYDYSWCAREFFTVANAGYATNGLPANIIAENVHVSSISPGGLINSGPLKGIAFNSDGRPTQFQYGSLVNSLYMVGGDGEGGNPAISTGQLQRPYKRLNSFAHLDYDLTDGLRGFIEASYGRITAVQDGVINRLDKGITIRRDNAFLPTSIQQAMDANAITSFTLGRQGDDFGPYIARTMVNVYRVAAGLSGDLGRFKWDVGYQYGTSRSVVEASGNRIKANFDRAIDAVVGPNNVVMCRSTLTSPTNGCKPMDIFGENKYSPESYAYAFGTAYGRIDSEQQVATANITGDLFDIWGGAVAMATGVEWRRNRSTSEIDPISAVAGFNSANAAGSAGKTTVKEGYFELNAPLLRDVPLAKLLELNGAVRYTDYSTSGGVTTWKLGAVYEPLDWLRLRVTRSRDIRAPNISELFGGQTSLNTTVTDPVDGRQVRVNGLAGGNPGLRPETADTWTAGVVLSPRDGFLRRFRASVDYYDIKVKGAISTLGNQSIIDGCFDGLPGLCSLVTRDGAGNLVSVVNTLQNLGAFNTNGLDLQVNYAQPLDEVSEALPGTLNISLMGNKVFDFVSIDAVGRVVERAGQTGFQIGSPLGVADWTWTAVVGYDVGRLSLTTDIRYIAKGVYDATLIGPDDPDYATTLPNSINNNRLPSRTYVNLTARYDLFSRGDYKVQLFGGITNLFDKDPPISPPRSNGIFYDVLGRTYKAGLRITL